MRTAQGLISEERRAFGFPGPERDDCVAYGLTSTEATLSWRQTIPCFVADHYSVCLVFSVPTEHPASKCYFLQMCRRPWASAVATMMEDASGMQ